MTQTLSLNTFPLFSQWPARLLGETPFESRHRNSVHVQREYGQDKWGEFLAWLGTVDSVTLESLLQSQGIAPDGNRPITRRDEFALIPAVDLYLEYERLMADTIRPHRPEILVELGSGLGDKILRLAAALKAPRVLGGEYTDTGVACGKRLAELWGSPAEFHHFDYNDPATLDWLPPNAVVFTSHSIEQIPDLKPSFFEALIAKRPKLVAHFEPGYEFYDDSSLLGLMRKRYVEVNDYNRNLHARLDALAGERKIELLERDINVFGENPLNPTTTAVWRPC